MFRLRQRGASIWIREESRSSAGASGARRSAKVVAVATVERCNAADEVHAGEPLRGRVT